jgi:hypothetical protein
MASLVLSDTGPVRKLSALRWSCTWASAGLTWTHPKSPSESRWSVWSRKCTGIVFATREYTSSDFGCRSQTTLLRHLENEYCVVVGRALVRQRSARPRAPVGARPECFLRHSDSAARYLHSLAPPRAHIESAGQTKPPRPVPNCVSLFSLPHGKAGGGVLLAPNFFRNLARWIRVDLLGSRPVALISLPACTACNNGSPAGSSI